MTAASSTGSAPPASGKSRIATARSVRQRRGGDIPRVASAGRLYVPARVARPGGPCMGAPPARCGAEQVRSLSHGPTMWGVRSGPAPGRRKTEVVGHQVGGAIRSRRWANIGATAPPAAALTVCVPAHPACRGDRTTTTSATHSSRSRRRPQRCPAQYRGKLVEGLSHQRVGASSGRAVHRSWHQWSSKTRASSRDLVSTASTPEDPSGAGPRRPLRTSDGASRGNMLKVHRRTPRPARSSARRRTAPIATKVRDGVDHGRRSRRSRASSRALFSGAVDQLQAVLPRSQRPPPVGRAGTDGAGGTYGSRDQAEERLPNRRPVARQGLNA